MSIYFSQYDTEIDEDHAAYCRLLEKKIHYLTSILADAGLLKGADGKVFKNLPDELVSDAAEVQRSLRPENF